MVHPLKLEQRTFLKRNRAFIFVVNLVLLCYIQNEQSNLFQKIISYFAFSSKILKRFVELYHQISIIVLYESISRGLQINAKAIIEEIINKILFHHFFILYNNINFYEHVWNQQLYN